MVRRHALDDTDELEIDGHRQAMAADVDVAPVAFALTVLPFKGRTLVQTWTILAPFSDMC